MLPTGPRYTYPLSPGPQAGSRDLARQILQTIQAEIARKNEVRTGLMSTGCDGQPVIDRLDGTGCGNGGRQVVFNPRTGIPLGQPGKLACSGPTVTTVHPAACATVRAGLRRRRRFVDNLGNVYGPAGKFLSAGGHAPAELEADYVHDLENAWGVSFFYDPPAYIKTSSLTLRKTSGPIASLRLVPSDSSGYAQGTIWPSSGDILGSSMVVSSAGVTGLDDATFGGSYSGSEGYERFFQVMIDGVPGGGDPDTFRLAVTYDAHSVVTNDIPITGAMQDLGFGLSVSFAAPTGHTNGDTWTASAFAGGQITRHGVAARGTITKAGPCVPPNNRVLMTTEMASGVDIVFADNAYGGRDTYTHTIVKAAATTTHSLVVRDADTLALLYRKSLDAAGAYTLGDPPQQFCFSTNAEGLFFMHCYTTPDVGGAPSPYPGHEFGSPDRRKIAVISVNPLTFEPTIEEVITLGDAGTDRSTFAVAIAP